ncbi:MAG: hypothetical protein AAFP03_08080 [Cyanobacteria bacterium J06598_3]
MAIENRRLNNGLNRSLNSYLARGLKRWDETSANVSRPVLVGLVVASTLLGCTSSVSVPSESADLNQPAEVLPTPAETPPVGTPSAEVPPTDTLAVDLLESDDAKQLPAGLEAAPSAAPPSPEEKAVTERLVIASINDPQAVRVFLAQMREAAAACEAGCESEQSRDAIARLVHYPFTTYDAGEVVETYNAPEDLLVDFEQVVTQPVLNAMREVQYESLFANYQGVMIGNGEVWFSEFDEGLKIKAINGQS